MPEFSSGQRTVLCALVAAAETVAHLEAAVGAMAVAWLPTVTPAMLPDATTTTSRDSTSHPGATSSEDTAAHEARMRFLTKQIRIKAAIVLVLGPLNPRALWCWVLSPALSRAAGRVCDNGSDATSISATSRASAGVIPSRLNMHYQPAWLVHAFFAVRPCCPTLTATQQAAASTVADIIPPPAGPSSWSTFFDTQRQVAAGRARVRAQRMEGDFTGTGVVCASGGRVDPKDVAMSGLDWRLSIFAACALRMTSSPKRSAAATAKTFAGLRSQLINLTQAFLCYDWCFRRGVPAPTTTFGDDGFDRRVNGDDDCLNGDRKGLSSADAAGAVQRTSSAGTMLFEHPSISLLILAYLC
jgi:hypothetical protein